MRGPVNYHAFSREHSTYFSSAVACSTYIRSLLARNGCIAQGVGGCHAPSWQRLLYPHVDKSRPAALVRDYTFSAHGRVRC